MNLPTIPTDVWLKATDQDKLEALGLMNGLQSRKALSEKSAEVVDASYFIALEGVTRYGLTKAVISVLQNALGHPFYPLPPELRGLCDKAMEPHENMRDRVHHREQLKAQIIPDRPEPTPEEKARVAAIYRRFCESTEAASQREASEAERAEIRARYGMTPESLASIKDQPFTGQRLGRQSEA